MKCIECKAQMSYIETWDLKCPVCKGHVIEDDGTECIFTREEHNQLIQDKLRDYEEEI